MQPRVSISQNDLEGTFATFNVAHNAVPRSIPELVSAEGNVRVRSGRQVRKNVRDKGQVREAMGGWQIIATKG